MIEDPFVEKTKMLMQLHYILTVDFNINRFVKKIKFRPDKTPLLITNRIICYNG